MRVVISKSTRDDKKLQARVGDQTVHFGDAGMSDYTLHRDSERKARYQRRHRKREDWSRSGIDTPGFYAKHVLWNKPSLKESIADLNKRYKDVSFELKTLRDMPIGKARTLR
jgi:hypothetical protein